MSTRTDATYDDATTSPRTDPTTTDDFPTDATTASGTTASSTDTTPESDALTPHGDTSWTDQCKRQFSTTSTTRCRNLSDDANEAMHDGV
jgi:hypothetical protein